MAGISILLLTGVVTTIIIVLSVIAIYMIVSYVFESIAVMRFRKNLNLKNNAISFIPFYNRYLLGKVTDNKILGAVLALVSMLKTITFVLWFFVGKSFALELFILSLIVGFVLNIIVASNIYKLYSKYNVVFTILTIITLGVLRPVFLFALRDSKQIV